MTRQEQDELIRRQLERTRVRAYYIYQARGGYPGDGKQLADWFQAQSEMWNEGV